VVYFVLMSEHKKRHHTSVLAIGAAVQDVFLQGTVFEPHCEDKYCVEEFALGSKNDIDNVVFSTGGGATNAAVTFARQGLHAFYLGKIGNDVAGRAVLDDLHKDTVDTSLVGYSKTHGTGYSCLLLAPNGERTILTYRGASTHYEITESDFHDVRPDWIYLSSVEGNFDILHTVFAYAKHHKIKIAMNPGKKELANKKELIKLIPQLTVLSMNLQEMQQIYDGENREDLIRAANSEVPFVVVTDGPNGASAGNQKQIVHAGMYEDVPVIDRTGAGDAFSSGFTAMVAAGESLAQAVTFASANSTSVVGYIGAKAGILQHDAKIHAMPLKVKSF
jgi:sugar/nucleoside kinase (ribokinase family)